MLSGCMLVGGAYQPAATVVPDAWYYSVRNDLHSGNSSLETWWERFNDSTLNRLVDRTQSSNPELKIAAERIEEARAARNVARSALFPTIDASGDAIRSRTSENLPGSRGKTSEFWSTGFDAGWEIDFFGGVRRSIESATASAEAVEEAYRDTMVSLLAEVAINYVQYRTAGERIRFAEANITNQRDSVKLTTDRFTAGLAPELDVTQAATNLASSEALLPMLRNQAALAAARLSTLAGGYPGSVDSWLGGGKGIPLPSSGFGIGLPADLVRSRPDIRYAERQLAAQTALIGVAQAELFPRFTLFGDLKLQAGSASDLLDTDSRSYSFGPSFRWQIFSAGRVKENIRIEESRTKQAYLAYESTVLRAMAEVESALVSVAEERDRLAKLESAVASAQKTVSLVKDNYREGLVDFQRVLDAERTIFATQDEAAISRGLIAANYVALFKALGGGTKMRVDAMPANDKP
jgi:NodT family efflux transporter outer membrane factor (OMF) lipoprotein